VKSRLFEDEIVLAFRDPAYAPYFIDIGAGDGSTWSNSLLLTESGWSGVCFERFAPKFERLTEIHKSRPTVVCRRDSVTAENINGMLYHAMCPDNPCLLSVDIDGIDAYVIKAVLSEFSPQIVIAEYNHMIPPPVRFCVNYDAGFVWGRNSFFGASVDHLNDIMSARGFGLTHVMGGNAIFMRGKASLGTTTQLWLAEHVPFIRITNEADSITLATANAINYPDKIKLVNDMFSQFAGQYRVSMDPL
jgi:hypothetical protein